MACPKTTTYKLPEDAADSESRHPRGELKEKGGYECEFVEPPPKQLQSECSICKLVLREPHILSCCGNNFCEACIGRIQRDRKPCPLCNEPGFRTVANGNLKRSLSDFQVRCPHRELGCEWVDELGKLDQHLNTDPQPEYQLEGCPFASIKCILCKDHMRRHVIAGHQIEHCPKRPSTCEYCEEYESTCEDVANHWEECKCYLLLCPNNCEPSRSGIERQNLEHHMKKECPLTIVECDFHSAGCKVKLQRKDMAGHMKEELMAHNSLLAAENQRLAKELLEKDRRLLEQMQTDISSQKLTRRLENTIRHRNLLLVALIVSIVLAYAYNYEPSESALQDRNQPTEALLLKDFLQKATQELVKLKQEVLKKYQELVEPKQELLQRANQELVELKQDLLQKANQELVELKQKLLKKASQELVKLKQELSHEAVHELILLGQNLEQGLKSEEVLKEHYCHIQKQEEEGDESWSWNPLNYLWNLIDIFYGANKNSPTSALRKV